MKHFNKLSFTAAALMLLALSACEEEGMQVYTGANVVRFMTEASSVDESAIAPVAIPVVFTKTSAIPASVSVSVSAENATEGLNYVILNTSLNFDFAANEYSDTIYVLPIDDLDATGDKALVFSLSTSTSGIGVGFPGPDGLNSTHTLTILDNDCPKPLEGTWTITPSGCTGNGTGGCNTTFDPFPFSTTVTITQVSCDGDGKYVVDDITFGLYPEGYGSSANPGTFIVNNGVITVIEAESPDVVYGGDAFFGTGQVNDDGTILIEAQNSYGDASGGILSPQ